MKDGRAIESRLGARLPTPDQTRPTLGLTQSPIKWVWGLLRGVNHPPSSSAEVKETVVLYLYSPSRPSWPVLGQNLPFNKNILNR